MKVSEQFCAIQGQNLLGGKDLFYNLKGRILILIFRNNPIFYDMTTFCFDYGLGTILHINDMIVENDWIDGCPSGLKQYKTLSVTSAGSQPMTQILV